MQGAPTPNVRTLRPADLASVVELDALLTGETKQAYWDGICKRFLRQKGGVALGTFHEASDSDPRLDGYLFGELRAFEFGSEACGWVFAVGVRPDAARTGVGSALLAAARGRFRKLGVQAVRTMVRRTDVPLLSFFRRHGFVGGPFVQLELDLPGDDLPEEHS